MVECESDAKSDLVKYFSEDTLNEIFVNEQILTKTDIFLEEKVTGPFRKWHIIISVFIVVFSIMFLICSLVKIRLPRTKAEIVADSKRRELLKKFQQKLVELKNAELDTMDYRRAVERLKQELEADTASLSPSEASIMSLCDDTQIQREGVVESSV
ncbi:unnamed protein product [Lepeophtheirus salmonis]|uniref:(salmon louse) hypothetical protein n=1 Tax=Lepeophtheirus salmonis TaxID=72036 RepID=A0A7R8CXV7_LEPSM|nr:uncharacterized protein LOC121116305 [Lepeophtheirus salmonis]CAB4063178.1 unnamed protein product [Lepeophtheirus salmonis]CAF2918494.1 unnamed protein product [Lepeophtheirus salmonis]